MLKLIYILIFTASSPNLISINRYNFFATPCTRNFRRSKQLTNPARLGVGFPCMLTPSWPSWPSWPYFNGCQGFGWSGDTARGSLWGEVRSFSSWDPSKVNWCNPIVVEPVWIVLVVAPSLFNLWSCMICKWYQGHQKTYFRLRPRRSHLRNQRLRPGKLILIILNPLMVIADATFYQD